MVYILIKLSIFYVFENIKTFIIIGQSKKLDILI